MGWWDNLFCVLFLSHCYTLNSISSVSENKMWFCACPAQLPTVLLCSLELSNLVQALWKMGILNGLIWRTPKQPNISIWYSTRSGIEYRFASNLITMLYGQLDKCLFSALTEKSSVWFVPHNNNPKNCLYGRRCGTIWPLLLHVITNLQRKDTTSLS